jgi:hypothetical protein
MPADRLRVDAEPPRDRVVSDAVLDLALMIASDCIKWPRSGPKCYENLKIKFLI